MQTLLLANALRSEKSREAGGEEAMKTPRQIFDAAISEANFEALITALAHLKGWTIAGFRPGRTEKGWRTPVKYDGQGFVDLVLCRERVIFVEVKSETGKLSEDQKKWQAILEAAGAEHYIWKPSDWEKIERWLK